jgi:hypothetical protein
MTMSRRIYAAAVAAGMSILVSAPALAGDYTQLSRAAGIGDLEAGAMSLDQITAAKFSQEGRDNLQTSVAHPVDGDVPVRSSRAAPELSLDAYHLRLINGSASGDERQIELQRDAVYDDPQARLRLAASTGISVADAAGMNLATIAGQKFDSDPDDGDN